MRRKNLALIAAWAVIIVTAIILVTLAVVSAFNGNWAGLVMIGVVSVIASAIYLVEHYCGDWYW